MHNNIAFGAEKYFFVYKKTLSTAGMGGDTRTHLEWG